MGRQNRESKGKVYRFSIVEDDTHRFLFSFRVSKLGLVLAALTTVVTLTGILYALIALTPLRTTIPGYPDAHSKKVAVANAIKIDSLESCITRWELYAENLSKILAGESTVSLDSVIRSSGLKYLSDKTMEELSEQEAILRRMAADSTYTSNGKGSK